MLKRTNWLVSGLTMALIAAVAVTVGCDSPNKGKKGGDAAHSDHAHGPNDGELIVLGDNYLVAEMVHDEKNDTVTIYMLENDRKTAKPIEADDVSIVITLADTPTEFKLSPKPTEGEAGGKSSRFESTDKPLSMALANKDAKRQLTVLEADGKLVTAEIEHFDHHHDHDHDHEEGHDKDGHEKHDDHKDDHDEKKSPPTETPNS